VDSCLSPDGNTLASGSFDSSVKIPAAVKREPCRDIKVGCTSCL